MLEQCTAYLIARTERHIEALNALATRLGFGHIEPLFSRADFQVQTDHPPLKFFLMYRHMDGGLMTKVRDVIRRSDDPNVRFSPIILLADECDFDTYLGFIKMGFDDVLTLPDRKEMLVQRLEGQITADQIYFETDNYLGPDRRRMEAADYTDPRRSGETFSHKRHTVHRSVAKGSASTRTEIFARK